MTIDELKNQEIWVNWRRKKLSNGKLSKVPIAYNGEETGSNEKYKNTWTNFKNVKDKADGIGIILRDGICAIDIDNNTYNNSMVKDIIDTMDTYTEISPSGNGFHLIFTVDISKIPICYDNEGNKKLDGKYYVKNTNKQLECYISGLTNRFMTFTGNVFRNKPIADRTKEVMRFLNKYMLKETTSTAIRTTEEELEKASKIVEETISRCSNFEKFKKLYNEGNIEDYENDESRADLALCNILAFYCGNNPQLIDYMFMKSNRYREKWNRKDYKERTIQKAINECNGNFYNTGMDLMLLTKFTEMEVHKKYKPNDIDISRLFAYIYKDKIRYNTSQKEWFFYNGKVWVKDEQGMNASNLMKTFALTLIEYSVKFENEIFKAYCKKLVDIKKRENLLKDSKSCFYITQEQFDIQGNLLNCQNGTLNLNTGELQPHKANDLLTKTTNVMYNPNIKCERWEKFIKEIMQDNENKINYLQKVLGYSLLAGNPLEIFVILYGFTRTGKGTLTSTVFHLLGDYAQNIMPASLVKKSNVSGSNATPDFARLQGCRFLNMSEPETNLNIDEALLKTITGGDVISTRFLHKELFDYIPQFLLFINTNHLPSITDVTVFESNRVIIIEFNRHFEENERDNTLKEYFKEPQQMTGIFNWLLQGLKKYKEEGLIPPEEIKKATKEYQYSCDKLKFFIDNEMEQSDKNISVAEVYKVYNNLINMANTEYPFISKTNFIKYMQRQSFYRTKGTVNGQTYKHIIVGMKLKRK